MTPDEVLHLDLGDRRPVAEEHPAAPGPGRRAVVLRALAGLAALVVLVVAAPEGRRPGVADLELSITAGEGTGRVVGADDLGAADALDVVPLVLGVRNAGATPLEVVLGPITGVTPAAPPEPLELAVGARADVAIDAVVRCTTTGPGAVVLTARSPSGQSRLVVPTDVSGEPLDALCPPVERGLAATATGLRVDERSVSTRVVNHGTEAVVLVALPLVRGVVADGSTVFLDPTVEVEPGTDRNGPPTPVLLPVVVSSPILPVGLNPGEAVVVTLRVASRQCPQAVDATLEVRGEDGSREVAGSDDVLDALLSRVC